MCFIRYENVTFDPIVTVPRTMNDLSTMLLMKDPQNEDITFVTIVCLFVLFCFVFFCVCVDARVCVITYINASLIYFLFITFDDL